MKNHFQHLNKAFENRVRLGVMSALMVNEYLDFSSLKELLEVTDGNLASHTRALEKMEYLFIEKSFVGRKPNTRYRISPLGRLEFERHLQILEKIVKGI